MGGGREEGIKYWGAQGRKEAATQPPKAPARRGPSPPRTPTSAPPQGPRPNTRELKRGAPVCPPVPLGGRSRALIPTPHPPPTSLPPQVLVIFSVSVRKVIGSGATCVPSLAGGRAEGLPAPPGTREPARPQPPAPCSQRPGVVVTMLCPPPSSSRATAGGLQVGGDGDVSLRSPSAIRSR